MNNDGCIHFGDGTPLTRSHEATYLGNELQRDVNIRHEILHKMQEVRRTWFRLNAYWKATKASNKWKLIVFDAIIRSKLLYGLETIHITKAVEYRGLRKMLGMFSTFISRANTNRRLLEVATATAYPKRRDDRKIIPFSIYHQERKSKLLGHVLRCDNTDPLRQVSFVPESAYRVDYGARSSQTDLAALQLKICLRRDIGTCKLFGTSCQQLGNPCKVGLRKKKKGRDPQKVICCIRKRILQAFHNSMGQSGLDQGKVLPSGLQKHFGVSTIAITLTAFGRAPQLCLHILSPLGMPMWWPVSLSASDGQSHTSVQTLVRQNLATRVTRRLLRRAPVLNLMCQFWALLFCSKRVLHNTNQD